jgi:deazaflavin-dependent oxidoreductase (nitroreductase family)
MIARERFEGGPRGGDTRKEQSPMGIGSPPESRGDLTTVQDAGHGESVTRHRRIDAHKGRTAMGHYDRLLTGLFSTRVGAWMAVHVANRIDKRLMRWSNGSLNIIVGTGYADSSMLLRCTGAQSGKARDVPVLAFERDDGWVLIASAGGQERNPAWYHNLKAHPRCALLVPHRGEVSCIAHEAEGEERERAWKAANARYSGYAVYQQRTQRRIPVMVVRPENNSS